jgi:hypothetical protein
LRRPLGEHIECTFALEPDVWLTSVDPGELTTALLNLVLNARDVMPLGGKLTIEARNTSLSESDLDVNGEPRPGDYVMVAVTDTGSGNDRRGGEPGVRAVLHHQGGRQGTGLGLSMVYGFVPPSGGVVQMQSDTGQAASSGCSFPASWRRRRLASPRRSGSVAPDGSETILVVEDERHGPDLCRERAEDARLPRHRGLERSPRRSHLLRQPGDIDLLLHRRRDARRHVRDRSSPGKRPVAARLKVLFTSGYTQNPVKTPERGRRRAAS